ncbi:MAG: NADPH-dependent 7-cyano-7-deazaguanine reductase QueF [Gammaproteobacteria bacterium]
MNETGLEGIQSQLPLGQSSQQPDHYDPSLLVGVPRTLARGVEGIDASLFQGHDLWNCWEVSWLDAHGKPVMRIGQLVVPANSPNLVESKSLKLYLNSFANERIDSESQLITRICDDLQQILGVRPEFSLYLLGDPRFAVEAPKGVCIDDLPVDLAVYEPDPLLLQTDPNQPGAERFHSHIFRSNCPVTSQPDWATVVVKYQASVKLFPESLLAYLVSYRNHTGFHEACIERIYQDLLSRLKPTELVVWAGFVRRGGLDINPVRSMAPIKFLPPRLARH